MLETIRQHLSSHTVHRIPCEDSIQAAVAILLFEDRNDVYCVLTRRTDTVRHHKGEVSFPGGMYEPGDPDLMQTAWREAEEEIGVLVDDVEPIGRLDDSWTYTGFVISPFVGVIPHPYEFVTNPREVAYLIHLPYSHLRQEDFSPRIRGQGWTSFDYNGDKVWGATCRILMTFRDVVENEVL